MLIWSSKHWRNFRAVEEKLKIISINGIRAIAAWENICLTVWRGIPQVGDIRKARNCMREHIATHKVIGYLNIVEEGSKDPGKDVQDASMDMLRSGTAENVAGYAFVAEGSGLRMTFMRAMMTTFKFTLRLRMELLIFATVAEAAQWLDAMMRARSVGFSGAATLALVTKRLRRELDLYSARTPLHAR